MRNRAIITVIITSCLVFLMAVYADRKAAERAHNDMLKSVLSDAPIYPKERP